MANFKVGQTVLLQSGECGQIVQIIDDSDDPEKTTYLIALEPHGMRMVIGGRKVLSAIGDQPKLGMIGKTLDGYWLSGVTYGADRACMMCHGSPDSHEIFETAISRAAMTEVLSALMRRTADGAPPGLTRVEREGRFMVGVLISPRRPILVAGSGATTPATLLSALSGDARFTICGDVQRQVLCRGGRPVELSLIAACHRGNAPLSCAAPKLVDYANRHGYEMPYHMTEAWFDQKTFRRELDKVDPEFSNIHWKDHSFKDKFEVWQTERQKIRHNITEHGKTIESCDTCKNALPLLLCGAKPPVPF